MLSRNRQDYLKALYALAPDGGVVTTSALAARLGVSAPSVTNMLGTLARVRLVTYAPRAGAKLTAAGRAQALELVRRHRILETFLVEVLGLDWSEVHEDAEVLEHHVSDRVLEALDRLVGHPEVDPHGHAIPDRLGRMPRRDLRALVELGAGERGVVREIRDRDPRRMAHWKRAGLVPGATVRVRAVHDLDGVVELVVRGRALTVGRAALEGLYVGDAPRGKVA